MQATILLAVQLQDDQVPLHGLEEIIEQQGADDVDVLHVFGHDGRFLGRWVCYDLLAGSTSTGDVDPSRWHECVDGDEKYLWAWMPDEHAEAKPEPHACDVCGATVTLAGSTWTCPACGNSGL
jgi:hypothetical protein